MSKADAVLLVEAAAPVPAKWISEQGVWPKLRGFKKVDGLAVPEEMTAWGRRCERNPLLAWALWAGLRGVGVDRVEAGLVANVVPGKPAGALARCDFSPSRPGLVVTLALNAGVKVGEGEKLYRLRLGKLGQEGERVLVPGRTLEEELWGGEGEYDTALLEQSLEAVMEAEGRRAKTWLEADRVLGSSVLLGRLYPELGEMESTLKRRRKGGYLEEDFGLTMAGWWRLAYLAKQGVGEVELRRWRWLQQTAMRVDARTGRLGRYRHLQLTQKLAVALMEERGLLPLGVEYSATAKLIARKSPHEMKADVLLYDPQRGGLVWGEVLRRHERELSWRSERGGFLKRQPGDRYKRMREEVLPWLAAVTGKPVELVLQEPGSVTSTFFGLPGKTQRAALQEEATGRQRETEAPERRVRPPVDLEDEWDY